jgi:tRNA threonylcarbamoyladenosine biosynthesis protein TsaB
VIVLGLDTATPSTVAGVLRADGTVVEVRDDPAPGERPAHAARLLAAAEEALSAAGVGWEEVDRLAVGLGPGSFTGLRIGIASARALAQGRGLPIVGVSSLEALARGASGAEIVVAAIDARRGEVFSAAWQTLNQGSGLSRRVEGFAPAALTPDALAERVRAMPGAPLAVGDGAVRFRDSLEAAGALVPPDTDGVHRLRAEQVCRLGAEGTPTDRDALLPDYLREPDAVPRR